MSSKFPRQPDQPPFILEFLFFQFLCPAIVNPKKFDLIQGYCTFSAGNHLLEDLPSHATIGLVNASKLLKDAAMNSYERWESDSVTEFIKKNHPLMSQFLSNVILVTKHSFLTS